MLLVALIRLFTPCIYHIHTPHAHSTELVSFPPMIGHTTLLNLCGFTYGINGFLVAALASLVASAVVFIILRYLFGESLRSWSEKNETWKAVEAVVVSCLIFFAVALANDYSGCQGTTPHHPHSSISFPTMDIFKRSLCGGSPLTFRIHADGAPTVSPVYTSRVTLAVYGSHNLQLSKVPPLRFHRLSHGLNVGWKAEGTHGHW